MYVFFKGRIAIRLDPDASAGFAKSSARTGWARRTSGSLGAADGGAGGAGGGDAAATIGAVAVGTGAVGTAAGVVDAARGGGELATTLRSSIA